MNNISNVLRKLKSNNEGALIAYVMGGDPEPKYTPKIADALIKGGVDILELGIPFSDPIADGPVIQVASIRALNARTTPKIVLDIIKEIKTKHDTPIAVMTYYNLLFKMGLDKFFNQAKNCLVDGIIIPDLPMEEATDYKRVADAYNVDTVFLAAPSTTKERLHKMISCSSGFLYLVSHFGVTGMQSSVANSTINLVKQVLPFTLGKIPLAVGFGISKPEHVTQIIGAGADGVIVGSTFVNIINKNLTEPSKMFASLEETARRLKAATLP